ncbi:MAG: glycosyltransferase family 4 protein [Vicinamibacterales bacterium]
MRSSAPYRLAAVTSHPVQYQAPLFQRLASHPSIELTVFYGDDRSVIGEFDRGFGLQIQWDRPLLEGYRSVVLNRRAGGRGALGRLAADISILRYLWQERFDAVLIHSYATPLSLLAYLGALASGTPVLLRTESERVRPRRGWTEALKEAVLRPLLAVTAGVLVIGSANRRFYEHYGVPRSRQFFTPYAVDNEYFLVQRGLLEPSRQHRRREHGWTDDVTVVGFSGKLIPLKRVEDVIDAVAALQSEGLRIGLLVVGDGPSRAALEDRVRTHQLRWTLFAGFKNQSELAAWYLCMDALVLPSRSETWGLVLNEAMLFGLPIIASSMVGAAEDLIEEGKNGCVCAVGNVQALTAALRTLVMSPERRHHFGQRSHALVQQYSHDACVHGILDGLQHVTGRLCAVRHVQDSGRTTP